MSGYNIHEDNSSYERALKRLTKKYPHAGQDIKEECERIKHGSNIGNCIPGSGCKFHKLEVASSDLQRSKKNSFRVIFYSLEPKDLWLLFCYFKGEQQSVPLQDLWDMAKELNIKQ
ncbi:MAG TPA: hypothetical protein DIS73_01030 [Planctomycetia bacterium]|nr:MAG: hypothetical protein A3I59_09730 [Planctomycetes bacterium RIFCSPLOWO2_02_FULL_50_16]HCN18867.1 hypothetical protein [Planctomycetia bacterium]